jgi:hypothetical protein
MSDESQNRSAEGPRRPLEEAARRLQPKLEAAEAQLGQASEQLKAFIRLHPGACLAGAVALGFLVGRWASRDD